MLICPQPEAKSIVAKQDWKRGFNWIQYRSFIWISVNWIGPQLRPRWWINDMILRSWYIINKRRKWEPSIAYGE
jgi:hypothetical protein